MDDNYPKSISYFEIRNSQSEPEPAFCYFKPDGEWISSSKHDPAIKENSPLWLCIQILNYLSETHVESFLTLQKSLDSGKKIKFKKRDSGPDDPEYTRLIQSVYLGQISCHVGLANIHQIVPFSFDACFMIPMYEIQESQKLLEDHKFQGMVVYWKDGYFVTSDDYLTYITLRMCGITEVKVIVLGDQGKEKIKLLASGGPNLLPDLQISRPPNIDILDLNLSKLFLDDYIISLAATVNLKNLLASKCIVLSEDKEKGQLQTLLEANGFNTDETIIMSYNNCTKIDLLPLTLETLRKMNNNMVFIIHRDSDYLTEEKMLKIADQITCLGANSFLTAGTDIESHYLKADHINHIYPELTKFEAMLYLDKAMQKTRELSISKMLKEKYGNKHRAHTEEIPHFSEAYDLMPERYCSGKETMRALKSLLHPKLKKSINLIKESPYLREKTLSKLAETLWPY